MQILAELIAPLTSHPDPAAAIANGESFRSLGVTSLQVVELLVSLEERSGIDFLELELPAHVLDRPIDLVRLLESNLA